MKEKVIGMSSNCSEVREKAKDLRDANAIENLAVIEMKSDRGSKGKVGSQGCFITCYHFCYQKAAAKR